MDDATLVALDAAAHAGSAHPVDVIRLVDEVRELNDRIRTLEKTVDLTKLVAVDERRTKVLWVGESDVLCAAVSFLTGAADLPYRLRLVGLHSELQREWTVVRVTHDVFRRAFGFLVAHPSFPTVADGMPSPDMSHSGAFRWEYQAVEEPTPPGDRSVILAALTRCAGSDLTPLLRDPAVYAVVTESQWDGADPVDVMAGLAVALWRDKVRTTAELQEQWDNDPDHGAPASYTEVAGAENPTDDDTGEFVPVASIVATRDMHGTTVDWQGRVLVPTTDPVDGANVVVTERGPMRYDPPVVTTSTPQTGTPGVTNTFVPCSEEDGKAIVDGLRSGKVFHSRPVPIRHTLIPPTLQTEAEDDPPWTAPVLPNPVIEESFRAVARQIMGSSNEPVTGSLVVEYAVGTDGGVKYLNHRYEPDEPAPTPQKMTGYADPTKTYVPQWDWKPGASSLANFAIPDLLGLLQQPTPLSKSMYEEVIAELDRQGYKLGSGKQSAPTVSSKVPDGDAPTIVET